MDNDKAATVTLHQNAQRLLKPLHVVNPYADKLTFLDDKTRMRRDHMKYLTLIKSIALLHQYQRPTNSVMHRGQQLAYIEVTRDDIVLANKIAHEVLGRTLDELPPQTRRLLQLMQNMVQAIAERQHIPVREVRFTRRDVRTATHWSDSQLKVHCLRLTEMEYLLTHSGSRGHPLQYELLYDGTTEAVSHLCGLINLSELNNDESKFGLEESKFAPSLPQVGAKFASSWTAQTQSPQGVEADLHESIQKSRIQEKNNHAAHRSSLAAAEVQ